MQARHRYEIDELPHEGAPMAVDVIPWLAEQFRQRNELTAYRFFKELAASGVSFLVAQSSRGELQIGEAEVAEICKIIVNYQQGSIRAPAGQSAADAMSGPSALATRMLSMPEALKKNRVAAIEARATERVRRIYNAPTAQQNSWKDLVDLIERLNERRDPPLSVNLNESDYLYQG